MCFRCNLFRKEENQTQSIASNHWSYYLGVKSDDIWGWTWAHSTLQPSVHFCVIQQEKPPVSAPGDTQGDVLTVTVLAMTQRYQLPPPSREITFPEQLREAPGHLSLQTSCCCMFSLHSQLGLLPWHGSGSHYLMPHAASLSPFPGFSLSPDPRHRGGTKGTLAW